MFVWHITENNENKTIKKYKFEGEQKYVDKAL